MRLLAFETLCQFGTAMVNPVASSFAVALGATASFAGIVAGLNPFTAMAFRPFGGMIVDQLDRSTSLLIASCIGAASATLCATFASMPFLIASRVILGISFVIKSSVVIALASIVVPKEKVGQGVGLVGLAYTVAFAIAPGVGSWIGEVYGYRYSYVASALLYVAAVILAITIKHSMSMRQTNRRVRASNDPDGDTTAKHAGLSLAFHKPTIPFAIVAVFETMIQGTLSYLLLLVAQQKGISGASAFFLVYAVVTVVMRPFSSRLFDRFGLAKVLYPEAVLMCICPMILAYAHTLEMYLVASVFLALGWGSLHPSFQAESVRGVDPSDAALAANTYYIGSDVGMALGPVIGGAALQALGAQAMFFACVAMGVMLIVSFAIYQNTAGKTRFAS